MVAVKCKRRYLEPVFGLIVLGSCKNINICKNGLHRRGPPGVCRYKRLIPRSRRHDDSYLNLNSWCNWLLILPCCHEIVDPGTSIFFLSL